MTEPGYVLDMANAKRTMPAWFDRAACATVGADTMHPDMTDDDAVNDAKQVCDGCPIRWPCRHYAITTFQRFGVWGGTTPKERRTIRRRRAKIASA